MLEKKIKQKIFHNDAVVTIFTLYVLLERGYAYKKRYKKVLGIDIFGL